MTDPNAQSKRVVAEAMASGLHPFSMPEEGPLNKAEEREARHILGYYREEGGMEGGSFTASLIRCFECADGQNTERLFNSFPFFRRPIQILKRSGTATLKAWVDEVSQG